MIHNTRSAHPADTPSRRIGYVSIREQAVSERAGEIIQPSRLISF